MLYFSFFCSSKSPEKMFIVSRKMAVFNIKDKKSMSDYFAYTRSCSFTITEINDITINSFSSNKCTTGETFRNIRFLTDHSLFKATKP